MKKVLSFELLLILVIIHNKVINANNNNNCVTKDYLTGDDFESEVNVVFEDSWSDFATIEPT
ncbi:hypothetical protein JHK84_052220 [Glycine max]|nr:hypothetical protein JHK84_052220 [Glycine max]